MTTQCTTPTIDFSSFFGRNVSARFDGGQLQTPAPCCFETLRRKSIYFQGSHSASPITAIQRKSNTRPNSCCASARLTLRHGTCQCWRCGRLGDGCETSASGPAPSGRGCGVRTQLAQIASERRRIRSGVLFADESAVLRPSRVVLSTKKSALMGRNNFRFLGATRTKYHGLVTYISKFFHSSIFGIQQSWCYTQS